MGKIKFRAWMPKWNEGINWNKMSQEEMKVYKNKISSWYMELDVSLSSDGKVINFWDGEYLSDEEEAIVMQFTGLKDKNGKEIYESDLVKHPMYKEPVEVCWLNVGWTPFMSYHAGEDYEVVGNKFEGLA